MIKQFPNHRQFRERRVPNINIASLNKQIDQNKHEAINLQQTQGMGLRERLQQKNHKQKIVNLAKTYKNNYKFQHNEKVNININKILVKKLQLQNDQNCQNVKTLNNNQKIVQRNKTFQSQEHDKLKQENHIELQQYKRQPRMSYSTADKSHFQIIKNKSTKNQFNFTNLSSSKVKRKKRAIQQCKIVKMPWNFKSHPKVQIIKKQNQISDTPLKFKVKISDIEKKNYSFCPTQSLQQICDNLL